MALYTCVHVYREPWYRLQNRRLGNQKRLISDILFGLRAETMSEKTDWLRGDSGELSAVKTCTRRKHESLVMKATISRHYDKGNHFARFIYNFCKQ